MEIFDSFNSIFFLTVIIVNLVLTFFVYKNNPNSATNRLYTFLGITISAWLTVNYIAYQPLYAETSLLWLRLSLFFATLMSAFFFLLAHTMVSEKILLSKQKLYGINIITALTMLITISPYAFITVSTAESVPVPVAGAGIIFFFVISTVLSVLAVHLLFKKITTATGLKREQYRWMLFGILIMLALIVVTIFVPILFFKKDTSVSVFPLYTSLFLAITAYAILKHKFFEVRLLLVRSVAYTILGLVLGIFYASGLFLIQIYITGERTRVDTLLFSAVMALIIAYTLQPLAEMIKRITVRIFYKDAYHRRVLFEHISRITSSTIDLSDLAEAIMQEIIGAMHTTSASLLLVREEKIIWTKTVHADTGVQLEFNQDDITCLTELLIHSNNNDNLLSIDEVDDDRVKDIMKNNNISLAIALVEQNKILGLLLLSEKSSGDIYTTKDMSALKIIVPQIAIAVKNSLSYEEIKRFNVTLEEEIKQATSKLTAANEQLKVLDRLKDDFVSVASHELRTPMTAIKSYLWMALSGKGGDLTEKQKYYLDRSYSSTDRLIKLVNDMLNISRIESGRMTYDMEKVDLQQLVTDVITDVKPRADELGIKVEMKIEESSSVIPAKAGIYTNGSPIRSGMTNTLPPVLADPDKIKEVLFNLIGNSLKFTPQGGRITIEILLRQPADQDDPSASSPRQSSGQAGQAMIQCNVKDTGAGISKEDKEKLFQKFGLLAGSYTINKSDQQGTGLGLYISKSILEAHKGSISVRSDGVGEGAMFSFTLPVFNEVQYQAFHKAQEGKEKIGIIHTAVV